MILLSDNLKSFNHEHDILPFQALSKALTENELFYLRAQFALLEPNKDGRVGLDNFKMVSVSPDLAFCFCRVIPSLLYLA